MKPFISMGIMLLSLGGLSCSSPVSEREPWQRETNVRVGPERVFPTPIAGILPELEGARQTGSRGRLGPALVYWGYRLADDREVLLFGCGLFDGHYCEEAVPRICPTGETEVLTRKVEPGNVTRETCRFIGTASPGDLYPNCEHNQFEHDILTGLVSCQ